MDTNKRYVFTLVDCDEALIFESIEELEEYVAQSGYETGEFYIFHLGKEMKVNITLNPEVNIYD